jgi:hypothetical protein
MRFRKGPAAGLALLFAVPLAGACGAADSPSPVREVAAAETPAQPRLVLKGAVLEASGFATILDAPSPPFPDTPPPPENRPANEAEWYARSQGIGTEEAVKRQREQAALRPQMERLLELVRAKEQGNFTAVRMVHAPDWAYVFYFKRQPQETLSRYARHPRIKAALARYTQAELDALAKPWVDRLMAHRLLDGHGSDPTFGEVVLAMAVSEAEFREVAAREGWQVPDALKLRFPEAAEGQALPERLETLVRIFPHPDRALGATNMASLGGRIILRDGCLYIARPGNPDRLAYFPREIGLTVDDEGYLALKPKGAGARISGRVGEEFTWAGPMGPVSEDAPMIAELRQRCGAAPVEAISFPQSRRNARVRPFAIDECVRERRISRQQAWDEIRSCWRRQDAGEENRRRNCDSPAR